MKNKRLSALSIFFAGKSPETERRYAYAYNAYLEWGGDDKPSTAARFIGYMYRSGYADLTVQNTQSALSSIYEYLTSIEIIKANPFRAASRVVSWRQKRHVRPTATLDPSKIMPIIEAIPQTSKGLRDRAMLAILFGCGLRRSELVALKLDSVQVSRAKNLYLQINAAKGGKSRKQPLPEWVAEHVSAYTIDRIGKAAEGNDYLFDSRYGDRSKSATPRTVARVFRRNFDGAPHSARAAFATRLLDLGRSYQEVAEALGHSTTEQVRVYDHRERSVETNVGKFVQY